MTTSSEQPTDKNYYMCSGGRGNGKSLRQLVTLKKLLDDGYQVTFIDPRGAELIKELQKCQPIDNFSDDIPDSIAYALRRYEQLKPKCAILKNDTKGEKKL